MRSCDRISAWTSVLQLLQPRRGWGLVLGFAHMLALGSLLAGTASAVPVAVTSSDYTGACDTLVVPTLVDELGVKPFPANEQIGATVKPTTISVCTGSGTSSQLVTITNLTTLSFTDLWYVADPETTIANFDGIVNGEWAFKVDAVGLNKPLLMETIALNGIFEPGESWLFVIDDYANSLGLPASLFGSVGVGVLSKGDLKSSGSIIAIAAPEPGAVLLLTLGLAGLGLRGRKH